MDLGHHRQLNNNVEARKLSQWAYLGCCFIRPAYYKLIEECVSQIVLHKSGYDPDFRATKRFQIDVEPLIENLVKSGLSQSGISDEESKKIKQELEEALTAKQESEAKLSALQVSGLYEKVPLSFRSLREKHLNRLECRLLG